MREHRFRQFLQRGVITQRVRGAGLRRHQLARLRHQRPRLDSTSGGFSSSASSIRTINPDMVRSHANAGSLKITCSNCVVCSRPFSRS